MAHIKLSNILPQVFHVILMFVCFIYVIFIFFERLEITVKIKDSYEFKLMLRVSHDGFTPEKFHEICDSQLK